MLLKPTCRGGLKGAGMCNVHFYLDGETTGQIKFLTATMTCKSNHRVILEIMEGLWAEIDAPSVQMWPPCLVEPAAPHAAPLLL